MLCKGKPWFSMFHTKIEDLENGLELSSIGMVTSTDAYQPGKVLGMVSRFSKK